MLTACPLTSMYFVVFFVIIMPAVASVLSTKLSTVPSCQCLLYRNTTLVQVTVRTLSEQIRDKCVCLLQNVFTNQNEKQYVDAIMKD